MEPYQVETLVEFIEDFIEAKVKDMNSTDVSDSLNLSRERRLLIDYIKEAFEVKEI